MRLAALKIITLWDQFKANFLEDKDKGLAYKENFGYIKIGHFGIYNKDPRRDTTRGPGLRTTI